MDPRLKGRGRGLLTTPRRLPVVTPDFMCKLRLLRLKQVINYLSMESAFLTKCLQPLYCFSQNMMIMWEHHIKELLTTDSVVPIPLKVAYLNELVGKNHAIVTIRTSTIRTSTILASSSSSASSGTDEIQYYVRILSTVDKDSLYRGCAVLLPYYEPKPTYSFLLKTTTKVSTFITKHLISFFLVFLLLLHLLMIFLLRIYEGKEKIYMFCIRVLGRGFFFFFSGITYVFIC